MRSLSICKYQKFFQLQISFITTYLVGSHRLMNLTKLMNCHLMGLRGWDRNWKGPMGRACWGEFYYPALVVLLSKLLAGSLGRLGKIHCKQLSLFLSVKWLSLSCVLTLYPKHSLRHQRNHFQFFACISYWDMAINTTYSIAWVPFKKSYVRNFFQS